MQPNGSLKPDEAPLLKLIQQEDATLFIGSGISTWSGLPSWSRLIEALIQECQALGGSVKEAQHALDHGDMMAAAEQLCRQMSSSEMAAVFREQLQFWNAKPHEIHELIFSLGIRRFVTTNYDNLLEQQAAASAPGRYFLTVTNRNLAELADIQKASADNFIFKPHGDLGDAESLVLSDTHYRRIFAEIDSPVRQALETIFVSRPILFLGYSLRDPDLDFILQTLSARYRGNAGDLWAIFPDVTEAQRQKIWDDYRIRTISYSTTRALPAGHADLLRILRALKAEAVRMADRAHIMHSIEEGEAALAVGLARYAARVVKPLVPQISIRARLPWGAKPLIATPSMYLLDGQEVGKILSESEADIIIEGAAGSGKSWSVTRFMSECAYTILKDVGEDKNVSAAHRPFLPVRLDCQAYEGDFKRLVASTVPPSLDLTVASRTHAVLLLVDSIDEMPVQFLEDQSWSRDLEELKSQWTDVRTIYLSRRRDLIPDSTLPAFYIEPLSDEVVKSALAEISLDAEYLPPDFVEQLRTPYILQMSCKVLPRSQDLRSTLKITDAYVASALQQLPLRYQGHCLESALASIAASTLRQGRETFGLDFFTEQLRLVGKMQGDHRAIADRLIEVGLLRSETERRLRFSHRILTEYFASRWIARHWKGSDFSIANSASAMHLHQTLVWSAALMSATDREQFFNALLELDFSITCQIAKGAEIEHASMWTRVLQRMKEKPPHPDLQYVLVDHLADAEIPDEALPHLRSLTELKNTELAGWALSKLIPVMSCDEVESLLDSLVDGDVSWNEWNWAGPSLGERLDERLLEKFKEVICRAEFVSEADEDKPEHFLARYRAYAFETVIGGLRGTLLTPFLGWTSMQNRRIRGIVVRGVSRLDTSVAEQFILRQWDLGVPEAEFRLFLRLKYGQPKWQSAIPRPTRQRIARLTESILTAPRSNLLWKLSLLRTLTELNWRWRDALAWQARQEKNRDLKSTLLALVSEQGARVVRQRVQKLMRRGSVPSELDAALFNAFDDLDPAALFSEDDVLNAFETYGASVWAIVDAFLSGFKQSRFIVSRVDVWIDWLHAISNASADSFLGDRLAAFVSENLSLAARERVLARANDPTDPLSTFILVQLIRRMHTVTTDDLTSEAGRRFIAAFLSREYDVDPLPTPGAIATERFIKETFLPYVRKHLAPEMSEDIESILIEAGDRHGIRYPLQW